MRRLILLAGITTLMLALPSICLTAQEENKRTFALWGHVKDSFTKAGIPDVKIVLMTSDSTVLDSATVFSNNRTVTWNKDYMYRFVRPAVHTQFIIKATHPDYETTYVNYNVRHVRRNNYFDAPNHYMKRKKMHDNLDALLDEVVVKATRIKLVHKKDTLVFDATAFSLPDGSMLDALIRQLPGVKMNDDGVITVNGRQVDYLMLNGKDFFKGNNKLVLDNLPYYTVKDIRVYDRRTDKSQYMGRDIEEQDYVMDINLKREYKKSYIANAEAGVGTADRYLGRGTGIRLTENSAMAAYFNLNNINELRKPGSTGEWTPMNSPVGEYTTKDVGVDISVDDKEKRYKEHLTVKGNILDYVTGSNSRTTHFNNTGTGYSLADRTGDSRQRYLNLNNSFQLKVPFWLDVNTSVQVGDFESVMRNRSAYLNDGAELCDDNVEALDSVFSPFMSPALRNVLVNRTSNTQLFNQDYILVNQRMTMNHKLPWGDNIELGVNATYNKFGNKNFSDYRLDYFGSQSPSDYRNRYYKHPVERYNWEVRGDYYINFLNGLTVRAYTLFNQDNNNDDERAYRLDWLDGWSNGLYPLGQLPADRGLLAQALSPDESVYSNNMTRTSQNGLNATYYKRTNKYYRYLQVQLPFFVTNNKVHYSRGGQHQHIDRTETYINGSVTSNFTWGEWRRMLRANFWHTTEVADVFNHVTIPDDRNPLAIRMGNPDLKNAHRYRASLYYKYTLKNKRWSLWGQVDGLVKTDPTVQAFSYDRATGVYTYRNVNGDKFFNSWLIGGLSGFLDKNQRWSLDYNAELQRNIGQTADLGSDGKESELYDYHQTTVMQDVRLRYSKGKLNSSLNGKFVFNKLKYDTPMRNDFNTRTFEVGHNFQYTVPMVELQLASQLNWYYQDNTMEGMPNRSNLIWNIYVSRSLLKDKSLLLKFSAFDILGDMKQQNFTVGGNSFTASTQERLDQYFMLSLAWQFNKVGKKSH